MPTVQRDWTDRIPAGMLVRPSAAAKGASGGHEITSTNSPSLVIVSPSLRGFFALLALMLSRNVRDGGGISEKRLAQLFPPQ